MLSALILGFLFVCQTNSLSVLTDDKPKTEDIKADLTRQLLNQETVIRMNLDKKVYDLMRDMADMKTNMADMKTKMADMKSEMEDIKTTTDSNNKQLQKEIKEAKKEVLVLKHENSALKAELQLQLNETTLISADIGTTSRDLTNIKTKMADMKANTDSKNRQLQEEITDAKKEVLALKHENSVLKAELQLQSNETTLISANLSDTLRDLANIKTKMADMKTNTDSKNKQLQKEITDAKKEVLALKHENSALKAELQLQSNETTLISDNLKTTLSTIKQSQKAQQELSSSVSSLEVFQKNMSSFSGSRSAETHVGFTARVTTYSSSWFGDILVFPYVVTNNGNSYNPSTGKFTAPRAGTYVFFVIGVSYGSNYLSLVIVHNGADKVRTYSPSSSQTGTNLAVLELHHGDTVWVRRYAGRGYSTSSVPLTTFSGFLL